MGFSFKNALPFGPEEWMANKVAGPRAETMGKLDQRSPDQIEWDPETGMPIGLKGAPAGRWGLAYQQRANELVARRNQARRNDAANFLAQGLRSSESFRPGGYAAVSNGLWGQRAQLAFNDQIDAPDLMAGYREQRMVDAQNAQRRAAKRQFYGSLIQVAGTIVGGAMGGPMGAQAGSQAGGALKQGISGYQVGQDSGTFNPTSQMGGNASNGGAGAGGAGGGGGGASFAQLADNAYSDNSFNDGYSSYYKWRMSRLQQPSAASTAPVKTEGGMY